jgi:hypothetical protein
VYCAWNMTGSSMVKITEGSEKTNVSIYMA